MTTSTNLTLSEINDFFRLMFHPGILDEKILSKIPRGFPRRGRIVFAGGLAQEDRSKQIAAAQAATLDNNFTSENDPHGEHDFGAVTVPGSSSFKEFKIFWKIDYYSSSEMEDGADDPSALQAYRVLSIFYPDDY